MKNNTLSYFAILISLIAIGFAIFRVTPMVEFGNDTYIGVIATFIGILVTILVGYQIYNAVEINQKIKRAYKISNRLKKKCDELDSKIASQKATMLLQDAETQEHFNIIMAIQKYTANRDADSYIAFLYMLKSLLFSLQLERTDFKEQFNLLREYITSIQIRNFIVGGGFTNDKGVQIDTDIIDNEEKNIMDIISRHEIEVQQLDAEIRAKNNFLIIKYEYEKVIGLFWQRIEEIKKDPNAPNYPKYRK